MMANLQDVLGKVKWAVLFFLWFVQGLVSLWLFITSKSFEISPRYLVLTFFLLLWMAFNCVLIILDYKKNSWWMARKIDFNKPNVKDFLFLTSVLFVFGRACLWYVRSLLSQELILQVGGYLDVLKPILNLVACTSLEIAILIIIFNWSSENKFFFQGFLPRLFAVLAVLGLLVAVVSKTGLGIFSSYKGDWQRGLPAVPLLEWQILLAGFICFGVLVLERKFKSLRLYRLDIFICILIWAGTSAFWLSQPVIPNASAVAPHEPNFEIYPFIDSQTYDELAQSILIGNGFGGKQIPQRPLYISFLAAAHVLAGQDYGHVIFIQTLVFAFFPVMLFILGRDLFGRPLGISIALLAILRDYTSNIVSPFTGNLSYSKLYLSEIPTAMFLLLFLIIGIRWMRSGYPLFLSILLGGVLGLAMLIRTQSIVVIPVILLFSILIQRGHIWPLIKSTIPMLLMMLIVISPWLWRNWKITGDLIFDNPESQTMNLALRYSWVNGQNGEIVRLPGETSAEFSNRLNKIAIDAIVSNPSGAAWALTNSFINHGVNNILLFPLRNEIKSFNEFVFPSDAFWEKWEGTPTAAQKNLLTFYIFLFGLGVTVAWYRNSWLGLLPLGLNLIYNLWTSIALLSGQRFMLTMDWSIYLYYMLGVFALIAGFLFVLNGTRAWIVEWLSDHPFVFTIPSKNITWPSYLMIGILFFGIGISLPLAEKIFPEKYPPLSQGQLLALLANSPALQESSVNAACVKKLADNKQLTIVQGRAVYPLYYQAGDGMDFTDTPGYKIVDQGRLVFDILGQGNQRVIFPMPQSPGFFPHASDVILVYSPKAEPWFVLVSRAGTENFYISDNFNLALCK